MAIPVSIDTTMGRFLSATAIDAASVPEKAIIEPTDRSIPPVTRTNVIPTPMIVVIDACFTTLIRFVLVRKVGLIRDITMIKAIITHKIPVFFKNSCRLFLFILSTTSPPSYNRMPMS